MGDYTVKGKQVVNEVDQTQTPPSEDYVQDLFPENPENGKSKFPSLDLNLNLSVPVPEFPVEEDGIVKTFFSLNDISVGTQLPEGFLSLASSFSSPVVDPEPERRMINIDDLKIKSRDDNSSKKEIPREMVAWAAASASQNPALRRALKRIREGKENNSIDAVKPITKSQSDPGKKMEAMVEFSKMHNELPTRTEENPFKRARLSDDGADTSDMFSIKAVKKEKMSDDVADNEDKAVVGCQEIEKDLGEELMKSMPSVETRGPDGRRVEGFLYRHLKDQVCIVCICHGSFLSPSEFVKHAGGNDVANPGSQILVRSNSITS